MIVQADHPRSELVKLWFQPVCRLDSLLHSKLKIVHVLVKLFFDAVGKRPHDIDRHSSNSKKLSYGRESTWEYC